MSKNNKLYDSVYGLKCTILTLYYSNVFTDHKEFDLAKKAAESNKLEDWVEATVAFYPSLSDKLVSLEEVKQALVDKIVPDSDVLTGVHREMSKNASVFEMFASLPFMCRVGGLQSEVASALVKHISKTNTPEVGLKLTEYMLAVTSKEEADEYNFDIREAMNIAYPNMSERMLDNVFKYREENTKVNIKMVI